MGARSHKHPHGHHDHHAAEAGSCLVWVLFLALGFAVVEVLVGFWSSSLALPGDAGCMVTDSASLGLAAFLVWLTKRPLSRRYSYGLRRVEPLAALLNVVFVINVSVAWLLVQGEQTMNTRGYFLHVLCDVLGSVAARDVVHHQGVEYVTLQPESSIQTIRWRPRQTESTHGRESGPLP